MKFGWWIRISLFIPKILFVILLTVCHTILILVWRIWCWIHYYCNPLIYNFLYSHFLSAWYCIDIVRRNSVLVTRDIQEVNNIWNDVLFILGVIWVNSCSHKEREGRLFVVFFFQYLTLWKFFFTISDHAFSVFPSLLYNFHFPLLLFKIIIIQTITTKLLQARVSSSP